MTFKHYIKRFLKDSRSVGIVLFVCTILSLIFANSSSSADYIQFWSTTVALPFSIEQPHTLLHWINDLLMAIFFFLVGMEIKREILIGELSSFKKTILPFAAAIGGMLFPAAIFLSFNQGTDFSAGWGIPMATDIAFSLGVASLLGKRVPLALKVFLMALAIIDDLGAIIVIALFYGGAVQSTYLLLAGLACLALYILNKLKIKFGVFHILIGICLWYFVFLSGIHATIAGVLFALFVPVGKLEPLEKVLHYPINFIVLPIFALANTAIHIPADFMGAISTTLSWGIIIGLVVGKPLGITFMSWLMVRLKLGAMPTGTTWGQIVGIGVLAGIGFTMSIFIATLAFSDAASQDIAKIATLVASLIAVVLGLMWLSIVSRKLK